MNLIIREPKMADCRSIAEVHINTWKISYQGLIPQEKLNSLDIEKSTKNWERRVDLGLKQEMFNLVALVDDRIVGFCSGGINNDQHLLKKYRGEISALYILKEFQQKGIGRSLLHSFCDVLRVNHIHSMLLWSLKDNIFARIFYEQLGGELVSRKSIEIVNKELNCVAYGWSSLEELTLR